MEVKNILAEVADKLIEKGKLEEKCELAKRMKEEGLDSGLISKITSLKLEEVSEL